MERRPRDPPARPQARPVYPQDNSDGEGVLVRYEDILMTLYLFASIFFLLLLVRVYALRAYRRAKAVLFGGVPEPSKKFQ